MFVLGVTGGIGSGKSTVARMLEERGARVLDADAIPVSRCVMDFFEGSREEALSRALSGGEDYELLFTVDSRCEDRLLELGAKLGTELTSIGKVTAKGSGMKLSGKEGEQDLKPGGFDHFKPAGK